MALENTKRNATYGKQRSEKILLPEQYSKQTLLLLLYELKTM